MLCDSGASMLFMQTRSLDVPGLPVDDDATEDDAMRAGGGDESTVSRLGRFRAGGVMVVPAKTTGASTIVISTSNFLNPLKPPTIP